MNTSQTVVVTQTQILTMSHVAHEVNCVLRARPRGTSGKLGESDRRLRAGAGQVGWRAVGRRAPQPCRALDSGRVCVLRSRSSATAQDNVLEAAQQAAQNEQAEVVQSRIVSSR